LRAQGKSAAQAIILLFSMKVWQNKRFLENWFSTSIGPYGASVETKRAENNQVSWWLAPVQANRLPLSTSCHKIREYMINVVMKRTIRGSCRNKAGYKQRAVCILSWFILLYGGVVYTNMKRTQWGSCRNKAGYKQRAVCICPGLYCFIGGLYTRI